MKKIKSYTLLSTLMLGLISPLFSQQTLPEVTVTGLKYKYLTAVGQTEVSQPVKMLQRRAAEYDVKNADFYEEDYDTYFVSFYIPQGQILASYDGNGKLLSTVEKYKDISLPKKITSVIAEKYPQWAISQDIYLVNYYKNNNAARKVYKLTLQNGDRRLKLKMNEEGEIL